MAKKMKDMQYESEIEHFDKNKYVKVPIDTRNGDKEEPVRDFKTYKIVRRLV